MYDNGGFAGHQRKDDFFSHYGSRKFGYLYGKNKNWISKTEFHIYEWPKYKEKFILLEAKKRHCHLYGMKHKRGNFQDTK